jgi:L-amino acid N-acyltransferase
VDNLLIRPATPADLAGITAIYNFYVQHSTCTYQDEPETPDERAVWFAAHGPAHPVLVAQAGEEIVGWGALSPFHPRCGYRLTVEDSVYVRHDRHRRGIGRALLAELIERARLLGHHTVIAGISADQPASIALHQQFNFIEVARLREVGYKFGRWLDVIYMQLMLGGEADAAEWAAPAERAR